MSESFRDRLKLIARAYADKLAAEKVFAVEWHRVSREVIMPVLKEAEYIDLENRGVICLSKGDEISLVFSPATAEQLAYRPHPEGAQIKWAMHTQRSPDNDGGLLPITSVSRELIERHVEQFLNTALRIRT